LYFFSTSADANAGAYAMVSLGSAVANEIFSRSSKVLLMINFTRYQRIIVVAAQEIVSLVALLPFRGDQYVVLEDCALGITQYQDNDLLEENPSLA
jgi:hypothetical protein